MSSQAIAVIDGFIQNLRTTIDGTTSPLLYSMINVAADVALEGDSIELKTLDESFRKALLECDLLERECKALIQMKSQANREQSSEFATLYNSAYQALPPFRLSSSQLYQEFRENIWHIQFPNKTMPRLATLLADEGIEFESMSNDDECTMDEHRENMVCPITKKLLEKPVIHSVCHHKYSQEAIQALMKQTRHATIPCPVPGCKQKVKEADLTKDKIFEERLERFKRIQVSLEGSRLRQTDAIDLDESPAKMKQKVKSERV